MHQKLPENPLVFHYLVLFNQKNKLKTSATVGISSIFDLINVTLSPSMLRTTTNPNLIFFQIALPAAWYVDPSRVATVSPVVVWVPRR